MKQIVTFIAMLFCSVTNTNGQTPYLLKDIINGPVGGMSTSSQYVYYEHPLSVVWEKNGFIYFTAVGFSTPPSSGGYTNDVELWKSDGTAAGTVLLKDIYPGNEGSYPSDFIDINGTLYFTAYNTSSGRELWKTDGTNAGTVVVKEILGGGVGGFELSGQWGYSSFPFSVVWQSGNTFYFKANGYASAPGGYVNDVELWKSDGTDAGTMVVKNIYPGTDSSEPQDFKEINGLLFFTARNPASGRELWKTDGTAAGTIIVKEIISGGVGGFETSGQWGFDQHIFNVVWQAGNTFYFTANGYASAPGGYINDIELWKSDGTDAGTMLVKDIYPGYESSYPQNFTALNGLLFFTARNASSGRELWKTDGTTAGTIVVKEIISGGVGGFETSGQWGYDTYPFSVVWQTGSTFYFNANGYASAPGGYVNDIELWKSDGTDAGTMLVKDIYPGYESSHPQHFKEINGLLFFTAYNASSGRELWKTDGSTNGTIIVKEIISGGVGGFETSGQWGYDTYPFSVVWQTGNTFYFTACGYNSAPGGYVSDVELWKSDGTDAGTMLVKDIYSGNEGSYPTDFRDISGTLYFTAYNAVSGRELWKSDGSTGGTVLVKEIMNGNVGGFQTSAQYVYYTWPFSVAFNIGSYFYFTANDYATVPTAGGYENNVELWRSDGTSGGTTKVLEINASTTESSYPLWFTNRLGKVFFTAYSTTYGRELWVVDIPVSDGPELNSLTDWNVYPNPASNSIRVVYSTTNFENTVEYISLADLTGRELSRVESGSDAGFFSKDIDISSLAPGVYMVNLKTAKGMQAKKIIKE